MNHDKALTWVHPRRELISLGALYPSTEPSSI